MAGYWKESDRVMEVEWQGSGWNVAAQLKGSRWRVRRGVKGDIVSKIRCERQWEGRLQRYGMRVEG